MKRTKRIHEIAITFFSLVLLFSMTPTLSEAATLGGHVRYLYGSVVGTSGSVYIYATTGAFCGVATIAGVGPASPGTVAFETFREALLEVAPFPPGHYVVAYTSAAAGFCNFTTGALTDYYIRY